MTGMFFVLYFEELHNLHDYNIEELHNLPIHDFEEVHNISNYNIEELHKVCGITANILGETPQIYSVKYHKYSRQNAEK